MNASQSGTYTSAKPIVVIANSVIPAKSRWVHRRAAGTKAPGCGPRKFQLSRLSGRLLSQIAAGFAGGFFFCFC